MVNGGSRFTLPGSDQTLGATTDWEKIGSMIYASIFSLVWVVFFLSSFYKTRVAQLEVSIIPYAVAGTVSFALCIFITDKTFKLIRKEATTSFRNANLSQASFEGIEDGLIEILG